MLLARDYNDDDDDFETESPIGFRPTGITSNTMVACSNNLATYKDLLAS